MKRREVLVILTHYETPQIEGLIARARRQLDGRADVFVSAFVDMPEGTAPIFEKYPFAIPFTRSDFAALGYPRKFHEDGWKMIPGNADLIVMAFWKRYPGYTHYWVMEGDVDYTGKLDELFAAFDASVADLLCTNIRPQPRNWQHRARFYCPTGWNEAEENRVIAFLPFFRVSQRFLRTLDAFYRDGGAGHHEKTWPFAALARGLVIEDLGSRGPFTAAHNRGRYYTSCHIGTLMYPGTFRYRPVMNRPGKRPDMLWHPVKDDVDLPRELLRVLRRRLRRLFRRLTGAGA
ncbi:hypothetical protein [Pararhodobacter sp. SW119]|uniref:hypothetical protein n=1 Tax=Pararhodobacter sp. SW119 TaxID=2780075 RepID=UPI001ADFD876|nr:hypothetical protein [Pararhodobacter sp. SW119]